MEKIIEIDGKQIKFKATAATPRLYRIKFKRDLMVDLSALAKAKKKDEFSIPDLEVFENVAYVMAKQADNTISSDINEWLDNFSTFAIRDILPCIMELWGENMQQTSTSKKKIVPPKGK